MLYLQMHGDDDICKELRCRSGPNEGWCRWLYPAADGTPCGNGKVSNHSLDTNAVIPKFSQYFYVHVYMGKLIICANWLYIRRRRHP